MKNRNIPYGYRFENGIIVIDLSEANTLRRIINEYLDGKSLLKIAEALNTEGVEYMPGTIAWNKARIMRILDDSRYIGTDSHPKLIEAETYECIKTKKASKNNLKETDFNADIFKIADTVRCAKCGSLMHRRHDSRIKCADRWTCENSDCSSLVGITDNDLITKITECLNILIEDPNRIENSKHTSIPANTDIMRAENEVARLLDTREIDIAEAKKKMLECISLKYRCIPKDNNIAERLKAEFEVSSPLSTFSCELFEKTVSEIHLDENGNIILTLKNGQQIRKESER